jgi:hypothetical protein
VSREAAFQAAAQDYCQALEKRGLVWHHCAEPRRCHGTRGFPDLLAAGPRGLLLAELKAPGRKRSPAQVQFGYTLAAAGAAYYLLEPADEPQLGAMLARLL